MATLNGPLILTWWQGLSLFPFGKDIFSFLLRILVPYSGTVKPKIIQLNPGDVIVEMKDCRRVRNHLNSVHAIALINLGEMATGLSLLISLPEGFRAIPTRLEIDYLKKARGTLRARGFFSFPSSGQDEKKTYEIESSILNTNNEPVAKVKAYWLVSRTPSSGHTTTP